VCLARGGRGGGAFLGRGAEVGWGEGFRGEERGVAD